jgi:hypothetical protein
MDNYEKVDKQLKAIDAARLKAINEANTIEDLEALKIGSVQYEVGGRGGYVGFWGGDVASYVGVDESDLPRKYGVFCNYLGGGVRGSVSAGGYNKKVSAEAAAVLDELAAACKRAYESAEDEIGLNSDYEDGDTNWDAAATKAARNAGTISAY